MSDTAATTSAQDQLEIPPPPRPLTPRARRRSWAEAPVRVWTLLTALLALVAAYILVTRIAGVWYDRWLILHGLAVQAKVDSANGIRPGNVLDRRDPITADLIFKAPDGAEHWSRGPLTPQTGTLLIGQSISIRVDPNDLDRWTDRTQPPSWFAELFGVLMLLPLLALAIGIMLLRRRKILNIWRHGEAAPAVVVDTKQSSIAPRSRVMRYALRDGNDRRVFHTLAPRSMGELNPGDEVMILHEPGNPGRAVVAELYASTGSGFRVPGSGNAEAASPPEPETRNPEPG